MFIAINGDGRAYIGSSEGQARRLAQEEAKPGTPVTIQPLEALTKGMQAAVLAVCDEIRIS